MTDPRTLEYLPLDQLQADPANPKAHDTTLIGASVSRFGVIEPIVRDDRTGYLVSGHGRTKDYQARHAAGETPPDGVTLAPDGTWLVPVITGWSSKSDADAHAALIALNRVGEVGGWEDQALLQLLDDLAALDDGLDGVGYDDADLDALRAQLDALDSEPAADPWNDRPLQAKPHSGEVERGQIWQVGQHRLACADSRDPAVWRMLLDGETGGLLFTDPPYGIGYSGGGGVEREPLAGDEDETAAVALLAGVLDTMSTHLRPGAATYVCLPSGPALVPLTQVLRDRGLYRWGLVWAKDKMTFGRADYHQQHEMIIYGWIEGAARHPVADRTQTTLWQIPRPTDSDRHPTAKPVALAERAITNSSDPGTIVIDPFAGSASTLVAAAHTGRIGVGCEWEPGYVNTALEWLEQVTGEQRALIATLGE